jgi:hypothetical protein
MTRKLLFADTDIVDRRRFYGILSVVIVSLLAWLAVSQWPIAFPVDDAYITLHNAQVLLSGVDRNYGVAALVGATSPVHLLLVAGMMKVAPPLLASFLMSGVAVLLYGLGLARFSFQLGGSPFLAALIVVIGMLTGYAPYHLLNGLETGLAMAAATWALVFALSPAPSGALPLLCGVLPFVRPELGALSGLLMLRHCWILHKTGRSPAILTACLLFLLAAAPWLLWQWTSTGTLIPSTASAKRAFFSEAGLTISTKLQFLSRGIIQSGLAPLILTLPFLRRAPLAWCIAVFLFLSFMALFLFLPGGSGHNYSRYLFILLPPLLCGIIGLFRNDRIGTPTRVVLVLAMLVNFPRDWSDYKNGVNFTKTELSQTSEWAANNLPRDSKILVHDAGYISFATSFRLIDLVGLKTPANIAYFQKMPRAEAVGLIAQHFSPKYAVILHDQPHYWGQIEDDLRGDGWDLRVLHGSANIPGYFIYELIPPLSRE